MAVKSENFKIAGVSHYIDNVMDKLSYPNPDYELSSKELTDSYDVGDRIFEYAFNTQNVALVPEPDNEHDPNAVRVEVKGILIGYIKSGSCSHVKNLLKSPDLAGMDLDIGGGKFKRIYDDGDKLKIERDSTGFFAELTIYTRQGDVSPSPAAAATSVPSSVDPVPAAAAESVTPKKKGKAGSVVMIIFGVLFLIGGLSSFSEGVLNGFVGLILGGLLLYFGIKRLKDK